VLIRIGALSEQTGVSEDVIRSWERRYGLLTPQRTTGGFRLYEEADVARIHAMKELLASGVSAGEAARYVLETTRTDAPSTPRRGSSTLQEVRAGLDAGFRSLDDDELGSAIDAVLATLDLDSAIRDVFIPALQSLGDDWEAGKVSVAQEHFAVNVLRGRLMGLARGWDQGFGPRALLACPPGELHDVSLVLFGLSLRRRGWRVTFLGANTPLDEVRAVQANIHPDLTVLFAADWSQHSELASQLGEAAGQRISLAGSTARAIAEASGCRWLQGDPVTAADEVTREFSAARRRRSRS